MRSSEPFGWHIERTGTGWAATHELLGATVAVRDFDRLAGAMHRREEAVLRSSRRRLLELILVHAEGQTFEAIRSALASERTA